MTTLDIDGATLTYDVEGSGDGTLAFTHGWCSRAAHWAPAIERYSPTHRTVRWDRRGMGDSTTAVPAPDPRRHADDLAAILDAEGIERAVVVAHAGGGPTALTFATAHADRTEALVLVDIALYSPSGDADDATRAAAIRSISDRLDHAGGDDFMAETYRGFFGPRADPALVDAAVGNAVATDRAVAITELAHVLIDSKALARQVQCPVLWVSARPEDTGSVQRLFSDVRVGHVVGSGHFVQLEVPEQLGAMIDTFLEEL